MTDLILITDVVVVIIIQYANYTYSKRLPNKKVNKFQSLFNKKDLTTQFKKISKRKRFY